MRGFPRKTLLWYVAKEQTQTKRKNNFRPPRPIRDSRKNLLKEKKNEKKIAKKWERK